MKNNTMNVTVVNKEELKKAVERLSINASNRGFFKSQYIDELTTHFGIEDRYKMNLILDDIESIIEAINIDFNNVTTNSLMEDIMGMLESEDEDDFEPYSIAFRMVMGIDLVDFINQVTEDVFTDDATLANVLETEFSTVYLFYKADYESTITPHSVYFTHKRIDPSTLPDDYYAYDLVVYGSSTAFISFAAKPLLSTDSNDLSYKGSIICDEEILPNAVSISMVNLHNHLKFSIEDDTFMDIDQLEDDK